MHRWHFDIHRQLDCVLRYHHISAHSSQTREKLHESLARVCEHCGIKSYGLYEVYGEQDYIVKFWVPQTDHAKTQEAINEWLKDVTDPREPNDVGPSDFLSCEYHWLWGDSPKNKINIEEFEKLLPTFPEDCTSDHALLGELQKAGFIGFPEAFESAVRFFLFISAPIGTDSEEHRNRLKERIREIVISFEGISNAEVYMGVSRARALIDARVEFTDYNSILELREKLTEIGIGDFGSRTSTYICSNNEKVIEHDALNLDPSRLGVKTTEESLRELLKIEETQNFEAKGSWTTSLKDQFEHNRPLKNKEVEHSALKTICGFLNSGSGTLIVGALEDRIRYKGMPDNIKKFGNYSLVGIDASLMKKGFDSFQLHVIGLVQNNFGALGVRLVEIRKFEIEGVTIAAIDVRKGNSRFYLDGDYYVRVGASTRALSPAEMEKLGVI